MKLTLTICCKAGSFWLQKWSEKNTEAGGNPDIGKYIGIYFVFGVGAAGLTAVQTLILWIFCSIEVSGSAMDTKNTCSCSPMQASRKLHERMATAIFRSPMSFFD